MRRFLPVKHVDLNYQFLCRFLSVFWLDFYHYIVSLVIAINEQYTHKIL